MARLRRERQISGVRGLDESGEHFMGIQICVNGNIPVELEPTMAVAVGRCDIFDGPRGYCA